MAASARSGTEPTAHQVPAPGAAVGRAGQNAEGGGRAARLARGEAEAERKATAVKLKKLQAQRRDLLKKALDAHYEAFEAGRGTLDTVIQGAKELLQAELELATTPEQRVAHYAARLEMAKKVEKLTTDRYDAGRVTAADYYVVQADR